MITEETRCLKEEIKHLRLEVEKYKAWALEMGKLASMRFCAYYDIRAELEAIKNPPTATKPEGGEN